MDSTAIKAIIQEYFDANWEADADKIAKVFHESAHVYGHGADGSFAEFDKESFVKLIASLKPINDVPRTDEILSIDFIGKRAAVCRVKIRVGNVIYTDILNFIEIGGKWAVIAKIYSGENA